MSETASIGRESQPVPGSVFTRAECQTRPLYLIKILLFINFHEGPSSPLAPCALMVARKTPDQIKENGYWSRWKKALHLSIRMSEDSLALPLWAMGGERASNPIIDNWDEIKTSPWMEWVDSGNFFRCLFARLSGTNVICRKNKQL